MEKIMFLDESEAKQIHFALADFFSRDGDPIYPAGVKSEPLLSSAIHRPYTSLGNIEKYPALDQKAASLLHSMIQNHPFHNGNKRTALCCCFVLYDRNHCTIDANNDELYGVITDIAKGEFDGSNDHDDLDGFIEKLSRWLRKHKHVIQNDHGEISLVDFIDCCTNVGASSKESGGFYVIRHKDKSINISKSTRKFDAIKAKRYLSKLNISERYTGLKYDEFVNYSFLENSVFSRILPVLRKLINT